MKDRLIIEKDLIPYTFNILLADNWYQLEVKYNTYADLFTIGLYKDDECLCEGEPLVYGKPLFNDFYTRDFPAITIIPVDEAGKNNTVTWDNFGETVFLAIYNDTDDTINYSGIYSDNGVFVRKNEITTEIITADKKIAMEQVIISKGGIVEKLKDVPSINELITGIDSINISGGTTERVGLLNFNGVVAEDVVGDISEVE